MRVLQSSSVRVRHWNASVDGPLSEAAMRGKLESAGYLVARYVYPPGTTFPEHSHGLDKVDAVLSGRFRMVVAGHFAILGPGDWVEVPRGVHHTAAVVGDEPVVCLDAART
jgi:mannose-6-phosphate isomerase-like protein (cupin superfamily)